MKIFFAWKLIDRIHENIDEWHEKEKKTELENIEESETEA